MQIRSNLAAAASFLRKRKKFTFFLVLILLFYLGIFVLFKEFQITQEKIAEWIKPFGVYGPLAIIVLQFIASMTPIPDAAIPIFAVILYGPLKGLALVITGMYLASIVHYNIARRLGKNYIIKRFPETAKFLEKMTNENAITKLIYIRMFSFVSFDITSYIAGISGVSFWEFSIAALIGLLPTNITATLIALGLFANNTWEVFLVWGGCILVVLGLAYLFKTSRIK